VSPSERLRGASHPQNFGHLKDPQSEPHKEDGLSIRRRSAKGILSSIMTTDTPITTSSRSPSALEATGACLGQTSEPTIESSLLAALILSAGIDSPNANRVPSTLRASPSQLARRFLSVCGLWCLLSFLPKDDFKVIHDAALFVLAAGFADATAPSVDGVPAPRLLASTNNTPFDLRLKGLIQVVSDLTRAVTSNISSQRTPANPPLTRFSQQVSAPGGAFQNPAQWGSGQRIPPNFSNDCVFCSSLQHLIRDCPIAAEYLKKGKVIHNNYGRLVLPEGYSPPRDTPGWNMKERIDYVWRAEGIQGKDTPSHDTVSAHFLESPDECMFAVDASPTSHSRNDGYSFDEQLQMMQAQIHSLLDAQTLAVQGRRERFDGVEVLRHTGLPNPQRRLPQPQTSQRMQPSSTTPNQQPSQLTIHTHGTRAGDPPRNPSYDQQPRDHSLNEQYRDKPPHILQRSQGPMKPVSMPPKPAPEEHKHRYQSSIETSIKVSDLVEQALDSKITLSTRELLATSPEIRRHVKDLIASKKVAANLLETEQVNSYLNTCFEENPASSFYDAERYNPLSPSAVPSLPLRVIFPTFATGVEPECILDGGAQVVVMRQDVWEKLRSPITSSKAMSMESANSTTAMTLGLIENQPVKLGPITIYLQIQVVDNAPFEVLLRRPFFDVTSCTEISRSGGSHEIHIKDPKTGVSYAFPTEPRQRRPCVRGLLQPLLGCASHDQRYPSGRIHKYQYELKTPGAS